MAKLRCSVRRLIWALVTFYVALYGFNSFYSAVVEDYYPTQQLQAGSRLSASVQDRGNHTRDTVKRPWYNGSSLWNIWGSRYATARDVPTVEISGVSCQLLFDDTQVKERAIARQYESYRNATKRTTADEIIEMTKDCGSFKEERKYMMKPVSQEEEEFPIAFSILLYKDPGRVERLLRAIYRPQNYYCLHVDKNSPAKIHRAMAKMAECFPNVAISSQSFAVTWGYYSVIEPEVTCMADLWKHKKWKYFINLTGQEFPLKTNMDLVRILKVYNGSNDIPGVSIAGLPPRFTKWVQYKHDPHVPIANRTLKTEFPLILNITKGSVHVAASRAFVDFVLHNPIAKALWEWVNDTFVPDETYFSTLQHNYRLRAPGGYSGGSSMARFSINRYKVWQHTGVCKGKFIRYICALAIGDLPMLGKSRELFANKFDENYHPLAYDCLEELHYNRTKADMFGLRTLHEEFYRKLPFVLYSRRDVTDARDWVLSERELEDWRNVTLEERERLKEIYKTNEAERPSWQLREERL